MIRLLLIFLVLLLFLLPDPCLFPLPDPCLFPLPDPCLFPLPFPFPFPVLIWICFVSIKFISFSFSHTFWPWGVIIPAKLINYNYLPSLGINLQARNQLITKEKLNGMVPSSLETIGVHEFSVLRCPLWGKQ